MKASDRCFELIKTFEGFSPVPYLCPAGKWTIGYGSITGVNNKTPSISKEEADQLLRSEVAKYERSVSKLIFYPLTQNQFDALVSFTYNLGGAALQRSTLRSKINRGDIYSAGNEFLKWVYGGGKKLNGLVKRRIAERELFLSDHI